MPSLKVAPITIVKRSFGFDPIESLHHFMVQISRGSTQPVNVSEHLTWDEASGSSEVTTGQALDGQIRVILARAKWDAIADAVRTEFNRRLKGQGLGAGAWRSGENLLRRELGKELVLLAWAIEEADPSLIANAIANWQGLYPEERWWLYTQTAAATGHGIGGRNRGWRKAVRYALTENPVSEINRESMGIPEFYHRAASEDQMRLLDSRGSSPNSIDPENKD